MAKIRLVGAIVGSLAIVGGWVLNFTSVNTSAMALISVGAAVALVMLGWAEWDNFELYFRECFEQIVKFEKGEPLRLGNPTVKPRAKA